jgi:hypothetical protein
VLLFGGVDDKGTLQNDLWFGRFEFERICGNGVLEKELGEGCDGTDFGTASCATLGYKSGALTCTRSCAVDTSTCVAQ